VLLLCRCYLPHLLYCAFWSIYYCPFDWLLQPLIILFLSPIVTFVLKCYFDLFLNWTIEIMYFVIYLFCIVFYIACFLCNKGAVPISFLSNHQRSRILSRSRPSCSRPFRSYILTIRNWWTLSKNTPPIILCFLEHILLSFWLASPASYYTVSITYCDVCTAYYF
jgi:hypothetical protein